MQPDSITETATTGNVGPTRLRAGDLKIQAIVIALLALLLYCNTFSHSWAFDDNLIINKNEYVQQGLAGIPGILTSDVFGSAASQMHARGQALNGGRYRPLSVITFAIEQQFIGVDNAGQNSPDEKTESAMHVRHVVNVLLYMLSVVVVLYFFRKIVFPAQPLAAFLSALIFTVHPIHTEVVANIKSRDEILSLLFICLTFVAAHRYLAKRSAMVLLAAMGSFLLALLSKEYGVVLIVVLPLSFYWLKGLSPGKSIRSGLVYVIPLALYVLLRLNALKNGGEFVDDDVMNNCYLLATRAQKAATIILIPLKYIGLLLFPHPLSADYSFNQIPYTTFTDVRVWVSLLVHAGLLAAMVAAIRKRHIMGFAIALYLAFLFPVSNVLINIGAPMAERLIYHSSLAFAMLAGYGVHIGYVKIPLRNMANLVAGCLMLALVLLSGFKVVTRNNDWYSDDTLFTHDVLIAPNSVIMNNNAGFAYIRQSAGNQDEKIQLLRKALPYLDKAIAINSKFVLAYLNRGVCHFRLGNIEKAYADCDTVLKYYPELPALSALAVPLSTYYTREGIKYGNNNQDSLAIFYFGKAAHVVPFDIRIQCNLAVQFVKARRLSEARNVLTHVLRIAPNDAQALELMQLAQGGNETAP